VPIRNRMPVILAPDNCARWLDVERMLKPYAAGAMVAYPVSTRVNSPKNDDVAILVMVAA